MKVAKFYKVKSFSNANLEYNVRQLPNDEWRCDCPFFVFRLDKMGEDCKNMIVIEDWCKHKIIGGRCTKPQECSCCKCYCAKCKDCFRSPCKVHLSPTQPVSECSCHCHSGYGKGMACLVFGCNKPTRCPHCSKPSVEKIEDIPPFIKSGGFSKTDQHEALLGVLLDRVQKIIKLLNSQ